MTDMTSSFGGCVIGSWPHSARAMVPSKSTQIARLRSWIGARDRVSTASNDSDMTSRAGTDLLADIVPAFDAMSITTISVGLISVCVMI